MRSPSAWLFAKEWRELLASRAWWVMLGVMGPLVGMSFISAVTAYGELSGVNGGAAGVGEAFSPLVGIWAPTFSASELAAAFLLPFVAIRLVSADKQSGALTIEMQHALTASRRLAIKAAVLMAAWSAATAAPLAGVGLWALYGGHIDLPELAVVVAGHVLNGALTIALACAAAAMADHPATAAIVTLAVTVGTWLINFAAAINGGWWDRAAAFTPTAMVGEFQRGLLRADVVLAAVLLTVAGLAIATLWLRPGDQPVLRLRRSLMVLSVVVVGLLVASTVSPSWDASESRRNSFSDATVATLRGIQGALRVEAHFAPEDPRRADLERNAFRKLRRALPNARIEYVSATSTGLFEQAADKYGEIWYYLNGASARSRITTPEGVVESVMSLARVEAPAESADDVFRGYPLAVRPRGAALVFYLAWPLAVAVLAFVQWRT